MVKDNKMTPSSPPPTSVTRSATNLADDFDELHFFPPSRSSPPTMKNFISSASSTSLSHSSSGSSGLGNEEILTNDFTIGSRLNASSRRRDHREEVTHTSSTHSSQVNSHNIHSHSHGHNSNNNYNSSSRRASHPSINRYPNSKERYVFSNFRFLVKEGSNLPKSVDESIDWLSVEMVLVPEIENVLCPICLDVPFIPRFTRCGHIYCLPCLLQFFQTSEPSTGKNNWRTCPVCAEQLHLKQLRPVKFCPATEPQEGEIFHSVLIKKPVGHLQPNLPKFPNDSLNSLSPFQRLIPVNRTFVIEQILNPELNQLRAEIKNRKFFGEESLELSFYESSLKLIEDLKQPGAISSLAGAIDFKLTGELKQSSSTSEFYYFHQSRDGLNVFLHPFCMKILKHHFESYESIPADLSLPIIQLERVIVNSSNRKRFKYLDHLSLCTQIILVEVDLRSIVSTSTLQIHQKELSSRQGIRDQKLSRDQNTRDKSILEEWKMMEDDYYSITQATGAMDIKVPESVKLDNLDDEEFFPLPSSFNNNINSSNNNNNSSGSIRSAIKKQNYESSPSFSALAHSWNSPFAFNSTYSGDSEILSSASASNTFMGNTSMSNNLNSTPITTRTQSAWNNTVTVATATTTATVNEESPTLSLLLTSSTSSKKKILLFSNGLNLQKK